MERVLVGKQGFHHGHGVSLARLREVALMAMDMQQSLDEVLGTKEFSASVIIELIDHVQALESERLEE